LPTATVITLSPVVLVSVGIGETVNLLLSVPPRLTPVIFRSSEPVFVTVRTVIASAGVHDVMLRVPFGAGNELYTGAAVTTQLSGYVVGLPAALCVTVIVAVTVPFSLPVQVMVKSLLPGHAISAVVGVT